jgi:hypothetical protein
MATADLAAVFRPARMCDNFLERLSLERNLPN